MGHIFKRNGHWSYRIDIGKTVDGKRPRHTMSGFETQELARRAMIEAERQVAEGTYFSRRMQMKEIIFEWIESLGEKLDSLYRQELEDITMSYVLPYFGEWKLGDVTQHAILAFYQFLSHREHQKLTDEEMNLINTACMKIFQFVQDQEYAAENLMEGVSSCNGELPTLRFWTLEQVRNFLEAATQEREYPLYLLLLATGIDTHELLSLTWKKVSVKTSRIVITETTNDKREIQLPDISLNALMNWRECLAFEEEQVASDYLSSTQLAVDNFGRLVSKNKLQALFEHICQLAEVPVITLEDLRHTHAILLLKEGMTFANVAAHLGHHTPQITKDLYARYVESEYEEAKDIINILFKA